MKIIQFIMVVLMYGFSLTGCNEIDRLMMKSYVKLVEPMIERTEDERHFLYQVQFENVSNETISDVKVELMYTGGQRARLVSLDEIAKDDRSEVLTCIGPSSGRIEDITITKITFTIIDETSRQRVTQFLQTNTVHVEEVS